MKTCSVCERRHYAKGHCKMHYDRMAHHGHTGTAYWAGPRSRTPVIERILSRTVIDEATGCWRWPGSRTHDGYGTIMTGAKADGDRRMSYIHRVVYEELVGPIDNELDHVHDRGCRYRDCHNPEHLEDVTRTENQRRKHAAR